MKTINVTEWAFRPLEDYAVFTQSQLGALLYRLEEELKRLRKATVPDLSLIESYETMIQKTVSTLESR